MTCFLRLTVPAAGDVDSNINILDTALLNPAKDGGALTGKTRSSGSAGAEGLRVFLSKIRSYQQFHIRRRVVIK
jgi:hypothetical protein